MKRAVEWALEEDLGSGDCTSMSSVPEEMVHEGFILAKEDGVLAGVEVARRVFELVDNTVSFEALRPDGAQVAYGEAVIKSKAPHAASCPRSALRSTSCNG